MFELEASQKRKSSSNRGSTGRDVFHISRLIDEKASVVQNFSAPSVSMRNRRLSQHFLFMIPKNYHKRMKVFLVSLNGFCYT